MQPCCSKQTKRRNEQRDNQQAIEQGICLLPQPHVSETIERNENVYNETCRLKILDQNVVSIMDLDAIRVSGVMIPSSLFQLF